MIEKEAEGLGVLGRLAAAAVLLKMLDSHQDRMRAVRATSILRRMQEEQELVGRPSQTPYPLHHGPRLFVPAGTPPTLDEEQSRYQMGFLPNVPAGMDQGMVRLASDLGETMLKVARAAGWTTKHASLIPPAPKQIYKPRGGLGPILGPAGGAKVLKTPAPSAAQAPHAPTTQPAPAPAFNTTNKAGIAGGLATMGLAYGGYKALEKGVDYMSEEAPPTDWGLTRSGAPRLAQTTNPYGYPQIPR